VLPMVWYIMDDGSTDGTARVVESFARQHPFIHLNSASSREGRNFGSQYKALQAAYQLAQSLSFEFVGVQDADIAPERSDYYETILREFDFNPRLGIAGGFIYERMNGAWTCRKANSPDSVAGGIQMFRRKCFDQIGGYTPLYFGGADSLAVLDAQMSGWQVSTRPDFRVLHYRPTSTAGGVWRGLLRSGFEDASFGNHPFFELFKCARRVTNRPFVLGSMVRFCGYLWWSVSGKRALIPPEKVKFLRREQIAKLRRCITPRFLMRANGRATQ
jgi:biofilm PGA synthesis N-glycosyltransferase PgaC